MRFPVRALALGVACAAVIVSCSVPTDKSSEIQVLVETSHTFLLRGEEMSVHARAFRVAGSGDTVDVPNVDFTWISGSTTTASVVEECCGYATVTGVNRGMVDIIAQATGFEKAADGILSIRVTNPLEIDSVRRDSIHFGDVVTVYGIWTDTIFSTSLGGVQLIPYPFSAGRDPVTGISQISYWVPPPASTDNLFYLGAGVFGFADFVTTIIDSADVFEPNDTNPSIVNLDAGVPIPQIPFLLFINPALVFEPVERGFESDDWFKFLRSDTTRATTLFITYPSFGDTTTRTFLLDSLGWDGFTYTFRDSVELLGSKWDYCKGSRFEPLRLARESTIVALKELPSQSLSIITFFQRAQRYGLRVVDGYVTSDNRIGPDKYEENDFCRFADQGARRIDLTTPFSDTLTIDNPFDTDWLRIDVAGVGPQNVRFQLQGRPFPGDADFSDVDVYVMTVPGSSGIDVGEVGSSLFAGSVEDVTVVLNGGESYYVAIVDYAGVPTRYSLCMAQGLAVCTLIPGPPPRSVTPPSARTKQALVRLRKPPTASSPAARSSPLLRP